MICAVTFEKRHQFKTLLDDMHVARHKLYVEGRKWRELAKADGRETDQFDRESTVYFLSLGKSRELHGGLRLVPTTEEHMLDSLFPELCASGVIPRGPDVWEMSRVFVNHTETCDSDGLLIKGKLMCAMIEFAEQNGIKKITGVSDSYFLPRLLQIGADIKPLGLPKPYESGEMLAIQINIDPTTLQKAQKHYNIPGPMLEETAYEHGGDTIQPEEEILQLSSEIELLKSKGYVSEREQMIEEFMDLVRLLGSNDRRVVSEAENRLDDLARRARNSQPGFHHQSSLGSSMLQ